jgi:single-stranded DNA-binding protein
MAIAFMKGTLTRDPYTKSGGQSDFTAFKIVETYTQRGEQKIAGYHDIVAFDDMARRAADFRSGDQVEIKANIRYRADNRYTDSQNKNPFVAQFVIMEVLNHTPVDQPEEDLFADVGF